MPMPHILGILGDESDSSRTLTKITNCLITDFGRCTDPVPSLSMYLLTRALKNPSGGQILSSVDGRSNQSSKVRHQQKTQCGQQIRQRHHSSSKKIKISALYAIVLDAEPATNGTREELLKAEMQNFLAIPRLSADEMDELDILSW
ncbi:hypothetical protein OUZ56_026564 [Daphnia magna]|uniref:Uncharacterized protein n=1 Tax=Daphnia magna TaxID=35525 RepID=A0ABQ9ZMJ1_9CRUS|nr:hypothetical protein OUZ56_026564 [Daphnia magna]